MSILREKFVEVFWSVFPIVFIIFILHFTLVPLEAQLLVRFIIGTLLIIMGLTLFLFGVDRGITPLGNHVGERIVFSNKLWIVVIGAFIMGFVITVAEPGLLVYAQQIEIVTQGLISSTLLLIIVSFGIASLLILGFIRIIYNLPLYIILTILYSIIFVLALFSEPEFIIIAFDASGATTGVLAVPFILSLALGVSHLKKDSKAGGKDAFGTIAIVSAGAIISVMMVSIITPNTEFVPEIIQVLPQDGLGQYFINAFRDTVFALLPILVIFTIAQFTFMRMRVKQYVHVFKGLVYVFVGLMLFLTGVNMGFMDVGSMIGQTLANNDVRIYFVLIAFILGVATILAEPAVHVLTHQIEEVTSGYVSKVLVLLSLSVGVGFAVGLSALRIYIEALQVWHILLPGYLLAMVLMHFVPKIFVGMAFDAGGVATGPMIAAFILAFMQGATNSVDSADIILDGLGTIAIVALTPIITLLLLGGMYKIKQNKGGQRNGES